MTIEYTYPEQKPTSARVYGKEDGDNYVVEATDWLVRLDSMTVMRPDVPEVCEAMMKLAGHEWPGGLTVPVLMDNEGRIAEDLVAITNKAVAERILARLMAAQSHPNHSDGYRIAMGAAVNYVREECGL